jgi:4-hydroxybenzoyl-CoA reductase subunit beta
MDALPEFRIVSPTTLAEAIAARAGNPKAMPLGGGTDLVVNIRRGIVSPQVLIDMNGVQELHAIGVDEKSIELGASARLSEIAEHPAINKYYPVVAGRRAHRRSHASQYGNHWRQPLPRHALYLLQSE